MAMPKFPEARVFYRAANERSKDAVFFLEKVGRTTAAVYLAGYSVECMLKALILSLLPRKGDRLKMREQFRGAKAHDYNWLREQYRNVGGPRFPKDVSDAFLVVDNWGTELRYDPRQVGADDAEDFLAAVERIITWADGRL